MVAVDCCRVLLEESVGDNRQISLYLCLTGSRPASLLPYDLLHTRHRTFSKPDVTASLFGIQLGGSTHAKANANAWKLSF
jgi:hypothetical protein